MRPLFWFSFPIEFFVGLGCTETGVGGENRIVPVMVLLLLLASLPKSLEVRHDMTSGLKHLVGGRGGANYIEQFPNRVEHNLPILKIKHINIRLEDPDAEDGLAVCGSGKIGNVVGEEIDLAVVPRRIIEYAVKASASDWQFLIVSHDFGFDEKTVLHYHGLSDVLGLFGKDPLPHGVECENVPQFDLCYGDGGGSAARD